MFSSNRSKLALVAAGVGGAAVAGFGLSFGRDIYKKTKKDIGIIVLLLAVVFCPFIGGRGLVRGHDRGVLGTLLLTVIGSILLIVAGFCAATTVSFMAVSMGKVDPDKALALAVFLGLVLTAIIAGIGCLVGFFSEAQTTEDVCRQQS